MCAAGDGVGEENMGVPPERGALMYSGVNPEIFLQVTANEIVFRSRFTEDQIAMLRTYKL